ncbi:MAG: hypothetical protein K2Q18_11670 [Bdellovibrionales bacterium]|nr:hypothetical protein [Bdellovibrionales bacterium]
MKNRHGSYKKILIAEDLLGNGRERLLQNIQIMQGLSLRPYEFCTLYILLFLRIRHPKNWLQKKNTFKTNPEEKRLLELIPHEFNLNDWEKEKLHDISISELFRNYNLKGIPLAVNRTMLNWLMGNWKITLLTHIPGPRELLKMQVQNTRCITLTVKPDEIDRLVLSTRDPLSFVLHDLHHADCFFNQEEVLKGQLGFYSLVEKIYDEPLLKKSLRGNPQFKSEFDYVVSDMNAYVIHLFKCFKSAFIKSDGSSETPLFPQVLEWWQMPPHVSIAAHRLNTPEFESADELHLKQFFESSQEVFV